MPDPYGAPGCLPGPRPAFVGSGMPDPYREFWAGVPGQRPAFTVSHAEPSLAQVLPLRVKGIEPERHYSGRMMLRVPPEVHSVAAHAAAAEGKSLNQWATEKFLEAAHA